MKTGRPDTNSLLSQLAERGLAATTQRLALFGAILGATENHVSAEDLHRRVCEQFPTLSRATVYNNLAVLAAAGLIERLETPDGARYGPVAAPHLNLVCSVCGGISDVLIGDPEIELLIARAAATQQFSPRSSSMSVTGICAACAV